MMAFRNLMVESPAHICVKQNQLIITTDTAHSIPLEDISALLLENRQITVTTAALSRLGQCGCAVYICDEKHLPCASLMPYEQYCRGLSVLQLQISQSAAVKKRLWQSIVKQKIKNQALCLRFCGKTQAAEQLETLINRVHSGDSENTEAVAAQAYFPALFGLGFTRGEENGINAGLNYGYAILRGCIARFLTAYGFQSELGLHHKSALNSFNLADDLIEPFRPVIDLLVTQNFDCNDSLDTVKKRLLFNCLNLDILSGTQHQSVTYSIERLVQSLRRSLEDSEASLTLPLLLETEQHRYE